MQIISISNHSKSAFKFHKSCKAMAYGAKPINYAVVAQTSDTSYW